MKPEKELETLDQQHFERLWGILPVGSPLYSIGAEKLHECIFPIDRQTLLHIDPTRKHPYSLVFSEYFSPHADTSFMEEIDDHQKWLQKNNRDAFNDLQKQMEKCESNLKNPNIRDKTVADIIEYHRNCIGGEISREAIRKIARRDSPELLPENTPAENRDLLNKVEKIYEKTQKSKAGRPRKNEKKE
jgi:hypothetical protein